LKDVAPATQMYFVHSYYPLPDDEAMVIASCDYEIEFPCAIGRDNLFATQSTRKRAARQDLRC